MQKHISLYVKFLIAMFMLITFLVIPKCTSAILDAWDRQDAGQTAYIDNYKRELKDNQTKE